MRKRKFLGAVLAASLVLGSVIPALASANITIEGKGEQYQAYQILDLTTSLKPGDHEHAESEAHGTDCYNFKYGVNSKYQAALQNALADTGADANEDGSISDIEILIYLDGLGGKAAEIRCFADKMWKEICDMDADATAVNRTFSGVEQGYYLIAETRKGADPDAISLVMLDTYGQDDIVVKAKEDVPEVKKYVQETSDVGDGEFGEVADADIGDHVKFRLEGSMPDNIGNFKTYKYIFHDDLSNGLTLDADSVTVMVDGKTATDFILKMSDLKDSESGCDFEVVFDNIKSGRTVNANTKVVVEYTATLNKEAEFKNKNYVHLEFSANPYDDGDETSETPRKEVTVYTYTINVNKVDKTGAALAGAEFKVQKWDEASSSYVDYVNGTLENDSSVTTFVFKGLDAGRYQLIEVKAPDNYNAIDPIEFVVTSEFEGQELTSLSANPDSFTAELTTGVVSTQVVNEAGSILPATGGTGAAILYGAGTLLVASGVALVVTWHKKKSAKRAKE